MFKGTGIVTSVPSDAPDDYVSLKALQDKPDFAAKYGITPEMTVPFEVVPIINIPGYGDTSAKFMCEKLKITSPNDKAKLTQAKVRLGARRTRGHCTLSTSGTSPFVHTV